MRIQALAFLVLAASLAFVPVSAQTKRTITHSDVWLMKRVGSPTVSPDGQVAIFPVTEPSYDPAQTISDLWIVPADGSSPARRLTSSKAAESSLAFSPDSQRIAFTTRRDGDEANQIYLLNLSGGEATRLTTLSSGAANPRFSPDGKKILFESMVYPDSKSDADNKKMAADIKARKYNARVYDGMPFRYWDSWIEPRKPHLFSISTDGGEAKDLLASSKLAASTGFSGFNDGLSSSQTLQAVWSPDARSIVFAAITNRDQMMHTSTEVRLFELSADGGEPRQLTAGDDDYSRPTFRPDGKALYAFHSRRESGKRLYSLSRLASMAWPDGKIRVLTESFDRSVDSVAFSPDSKTAYLSVEDSGFDRVFQMNADGGTIAQAFDMKEGGLGALSAATSKSVFVTSYSSAVQPAEIVAVNLQNGERRPLTSFNAAKLAELELPKLEHFWFTAKNGKKIHSMVVMPPFLDRTKKYPLVLFPHGGPNSMSKDSFSTRWNYHLLSSPGYVLLATNYSGSTGFGEQFADDVERDVLRGPVNETLEAADELLKKYTFIDGTRQAAIGASYGGYFMNWMEGHTTRFRCLVNHAGAINNESQYGTNDGGLGRELRMGGPIWEAKGQWNDQSPIRYTGKWQTPMLITQGELDFRVPMSESMTSFKILQRRRIPSRIITFPDENHWILKGENSKFHQGQVLEWLEKYLKPEQPVFKWESR